MTSPPAPARGLVAALASLLALSFVLVHLPVLDRVFHNGDDWEHLSYASDVLEGRDGAVEALLVGHELRLLRTAPRLLWLGELATRGLEPAGYYLDNLLLGGLTLALLFLLVLRLSPSTPPTRRLLAGALAALVFGLNPATMQAVYFLSARDDLLVALGTLGAAVLWLGPRGRGWLVGVCGFLLLAALSKPTGLVALPLLVLARAARDGLGAAREDARALLAPALVAGTVGLATLGASSGIAADLWPGDASAGALLQNLRSGLIPGYPGGISGGPRAAWLLVLAGLGLLHGRGAPRVGGLGLGWLALGLVVPLPWLLVPGGGDLGRYVLLASVGVALIVAAPWLGPPRPRSRPAHLAPVVLAAAALVAGFGAHARGIRPHLREQRPESAALVEALRASDGEETQVLLSNPDLALSSALASSALSDRVTPVVYGMEGDPRRYRGGGPAMSAFPWASSREVESNGGGAFDGPVVVQRMDGVFSRVSENLPPTEGGAPAQVWEEGALTPRRSGWGTDDVFPARPYCAAVVELPGVDWRPPDPGSTEVRLAPRPPGPAVRIAFTSRGPGFVRAALWAPVVDGVARVALDQSPSWRRGERVVDFQLTASGRRERSPRVVLEPCASETPR